MITNQSINRPTNQSTTV